MSMYKDDFEMWFDVFYGDYVKFLMNGNEIKFEGNSFQEVIDELNSKNERDFIPHGVQDYTM